MAGPRFYIICREGELLSDRFATLRSAMDEATKLCLPSNEAYSIINESGDVVCTINPLPSLTR